MEDEQCQRWRESATFGMMRTSLTSSCVFSRYAQVGDGDIDHAYWGRPEDMTVQRPVSFIDDTKPGSDLAAEVAAAMSAASMVFADTNRAYADTLIAHAKTLYAWADAKRGKYSDSLSGLASPNPFYTSYDYKVCAHHAYASSIAHRSCASHVHVSHSHIMCSRMNSYGAPSGCTKRQEITSIWRMPNGNISNSRCNIR